jgi:23S rRNA pseudouridine1911/1915/1917 synthase
MKLDILYEDKDIVAINKPAGLVVHPDGKTTEPALTDWVLEHYPKAKKVGEPIELKDGSVIERPGIIHRLDRGTSGVILIAKTKKGHAALKEQFQNQLAKKKYYALVHGDMKDQWGTIDKPIGRSPVDFRRYSAGRGARGEMRPALTWWSLITYTRLDDGLGGTKTGYSLVEVEPKTGRTHQIRVHFKSIQHPVACDVLYAPEKKCELSLGRTALHAYSIAFTNTASKLVTVKAPIPDDFKKVLEELQMIEVAKKKGIC